MKATSPVIESSHRFCAADLIAGDAALDFVNTMTGRDERPRDWLDTYERLLEWTTAVELLPAEAVRTLGRKAQRNTNEAMAALARAKSLREALFALLTAIIAGKAPPKPAMAVLRERWIAGAQAQDLCFAGNRLSFELRDDALDLDVVGAMVAYRMVNEVLARPVDRLRICQGPNCSWLFIDSSKAGRRRWCDMAVCGNAAKARRFYSRMRSRKPS